MQGTPEWLKDRIRTYYQGTTEQSYLANWAKETLALNYGLSDETTATLAEAQNNSSRYVADALGLREGMRVLDAGCGVGGTSLWMATERRASMVGVTLDPNQVALGTKFAAERGVADRVSFEAMDYLATTFPEASFDAAFNVESVCHCFDVRAYAYHLSFLLADGAPYGCLDMFVGTGHDDLVEETKDGWSMPNWRTMPAVAAVLADAGFVDVRAVDLTSQVKRSAEQILAMANNRLMTMKLGAAMGQTVSATFEGHVRAGVACSKGLLNGAITYGFVSARRPPRSTALR